MICLTKRDPTQTSDGMSSSCPRNRHQLTVSSHRSYSWLIHLSFGRPVFFFPYCSLTFFLALYCLWYFLRVHTVCVCNLKHFSFVSKICRFRPVSSLLMHYVSDFPCTDLRKHISAANVLHNFCLLHLSSLLCPWST